jgi:hypothetical protein
MMWGLGLGLSVIGGVLTIWGAWVLYRYATPDLGDFGGGVIPPDQRYMWKFDPGPEKEFADLGRRTIRNRQGFGLIVIGSVLQLAGTVASAFA